MTKKSENLEEETLENFGSQQNSGKAETLRTASKTDADLAQENGELLANLQNLTADLQRNRAEFENYRKRVEGDLARAKNSGEQSFAKKVLPLLDVFDAVFANLTEEIAATDFGKGLLLAQKNLAKILPEMKLEKIPVKIGDEFDHEKMDAIASDGDENKVSEILRDGYFFGGEILRPAMVKVK